MSDTDMIDRLIALIGEISSDFEDQGYCVLFPGDDDALGLLLIVMARFTELAVEHGNGVGR